MNKMTVKEILLASAGLLGKGDEVKAYLDGTSLDAQADVENLLRCFQLVENELALDYLPLHAEEEIQTQTGAIFFDEFTRAPVRILRVCDEGGKSCTFKLFPEYVKTQSGKVKVTYTYAPNEKTLDGESDYKAQASVRLFAYGIAAEYALASGMFEDASVWDKKYKDAIEAAYRSTPSRVMRSRRWA